MSEDKQLPKYMTVDDFFKGAKTTTIFEDVRRRTHVADLKEIYSKEYLLEHKLCTPEEYETIPASTSREYARRQAEAWGKLANQVVGAEDPSD